MGPVPDHAVPLRLAGTGHYLPPRAVHALEVDALAGLEPGWTEQHTGVGTRHWVEGETAAQMGAAALRQALESCRGWTPDLLIGASGTPQQPIPCTAALIASETGWSSVPCFDVNATCLSFVVALQVAAGLLASGAYRRIAVVSTEIASKGLNWREPESAGLMGDGAAAVLVERDESGAAGLLGSALETWPEGVTYTEIRGGGSRLTALEYCPGENADDYLFHMDGPAIFRLAAQKMEAFVRGVIGDGRDRWSGIDWVIPHQASLPGLRHMARRLQIPRSKLVETVHRHGNVIAASIPLALHEMVSSGRLVRGQTVLFLGTSAGFSLGAALLRY